MELQRQETIETDAYFESKRLKRWYDAPKHNICLAFLLYPVVMILCLVAGSRMLSMTLMAPDETTMGPCQLYVPKDPKFGGPSDESGFSFQAGVDTGVSYEVKLLDDDVEACNRAGEYCTQYIDCHRSQRNECVDTHSECVSWARTGECSNNPEFMLYGCCESCAYAVYACADDPTFRDWSSHGYRCDQWKDFDCSNATEGYGYPQSSQDELIAKCPLSCGRCHGTSSSTIHGLSIMSCTTYIFLSWMTMFLAPFIWFNNKQVSNHLGLACKLVKIFGPCVTCGLQPLLYKTGDPLKWHLVPSFAWVEHMGMPILCSVLQELTFYVRFKWTTNLLLLSLTTLRKAECGGYSSEIRNWYALTVVFLVQVFDQTMWTSIGFLGEYDTRITKLMAYKACQHFFAIVSIPLALYFIVSSNFSFVLTFGLKAIFEFNVSWDVDLLQVLVLVITCTEFIEFWVKIFHVIQEKRIRPRQEAKAEATTIGASNNQS